MTTAYVKIPEYLNAEGTHSDDNGNDGKCLVVWPGETIVMHVGDMVRIGDSVLRFVGYESYPIFELSISTQERARDDGVIAEDSSGELD